MDVAHLLFRSAQRSPDASLWLDGTTTMSYREGAQRVAALAGAFLELGAQGDRVAILMPNRFEALEAFLAAMAGGMGAVPMNRRLHPDELAFLIEDSAASIVVFDARFREQLRSTRTASSVKHWVCVGNADANEHPYEDLIASGGQERPDVKIAPDDLAWLFYTSGTTGRPKGAIETHRNLLTMVQQMLLGVVPDAAASDVVLHAAPTSHGSASVGLAHLAMGAGQAFPLTNAFDPVSTFDAIERYGVTTMFLAPTMIHRLVTSPARADRYLPSLKTIIYGGAPMYVEQLIAAMEAFGQIFVQIYGQGEAPMTVTALGKAEHTPSDPIAKWRLASAGRELAATRVRIVDDCGNEQPPGSMGEVSVRGDLVMPGYWRREEATAETIVDGWLRTGDVGHLDEDGYLFLTDRKNDLIISGGSNIYPREVEDVLLSHPAVDEACVVGVADLEWGEVVMAAVVAYDPVTSHELIEYCRLRLASYKKPREVVFVEALPKNANGKILRRTIRERLSKDQRRER